MKVSKWAHGSGPRGRSAFRGPCCTIPHETTVATQDEAAQLEAPCNTRDTRRVSDECDSLPRAVTAQLAQNEHAGEPDPDKRTRPVNVAAKTARTHAGQTMTTNCQQKLQLTWTRRRRRTAFRAPCRDKQPSALNQRLDPNQQARTTTSGIEVAEPTTSNKSALGPKATLRKRSAKERPTATIHAGSRLDASTRQQQRPRNSTQAKRNSFSLIEFGGSLSGQIEVEVAAAAACQERGKEKHTQEEVCGSAVVSRQATTHKRGPKKTDQR